VTHLSQSVALVTLLVRDYDRMRSAGVEFMEEPRQVDYGTVVVFKTGTETNGT
jgi:hypothetical protein